MSRLSLADKLRMTREACEADLWTFIKTLGPHLVLGHVHEDLVNWLQNPRGRLNRLALLPRGHLKSTIIAYATLWWLTKNPHKAIIYVSATAGLAELQLGLIKTIMESRTYMRLWPTMIHQEEARRAQWNNQSIVVDHPKRRTEASRDPSIAAFGVGANTTGRHCDLLVFDDLVVPTNAYTEEGRSKVRAAYSQFASIANPGTPKWAVGTRYFPTDIYQDMLDMRQVLVDDDGDVEEEIPVYDIFERVVETDGEFVWPRTRRKDGEWFGFDKKILALVKAEYLDITQFYAQYYNDPNDPSNQKFDRALFQYYDKKALKYDKGYWSIGGKRLNIVAAMDFAFSTKTKADYTAIAVVGMDHQGYYYVLDLDRFKTDRIAEYFAHLEPLYNKWHFNKIRMEVSVAQAVLVRDLKENYIQREGMAVSIEESRPTRHEGTKEERINATVYPRYDNGQVFHYRGGNCQALEDELVASKRSNDDLIDVVMGCFSSLKPPLQQNARRRHANIVYDSRFGGVSFR